MTALYRRTRNTAGPQRLQNKRVSLAETAARGGGSTILTQGGRFAISFTSSIVLARLLAPHDFGLMAMVAAFINLAQLLRDSGIQLASVRRDDLSHGQRSNLFWLTSGLGTALAAVMFLAAPGIAGFYGEPDVAGMIRAMSFTLLASGVGSQFRAHLNRSLQFHRLNVIEVVPQFVGSVTGITAAVLGAGFWALVLQQVALSLTELLLSVLLARWRPALPGRHGSLMPVFTDGVNISGIELMSFGLRSVDSVALGRTWGSAVVGFYDRAFQVMMIPLYQFNWPLSRVIVPVLARVRSEPERWQRYVRVVLLLPAYVTVSLYAMCLGLAPAIIVGLYGEVWAPASDILRVLTIAGAFRAMGQVPFWVYVAQGDSRIQFRFDLIATPATIALILLGLPWGAVGVAAGFAVGSAGSWLAAMLWMSHRLHFTPGFLLAPSARAVAFAAIPIGLLSWGATLLPLPELAQLPVGVVASGLWMLLIWAVVPMVRRDLDVLVRATRLALKRPGQAEKDAPS